MAKDTSMKRSRFICFHCRKMFRKTRIVSSACCAECGAAMVKVGVWFEPPRQSDIKSWKQLELQHTQQGHWFAADRGPLKYYAKIPLRFAQEKQQEEQRLLSCAKGLKQRQQLEKRQQRLTSRSNKGRSLTNINDKPKYWT